MTGLAAGLLDGWDIRPGSRDSQDRTPAGMGTTDKPSAGDDCRGLSPTKGQRPARAWIAFVDEMIGPSWSAVIR